MKVQAAKKVHYDSGPNMTPLVDVVMVILIFLMLVGSFSSAEWYLVSNLPFKAKGAGSTNVPPGFIPDEPLEIRVDQPDPTRWVASAGRIQVGDSASLRAALNKMRLEFNATGTPTDKVQVVLAPGRMVKYEYLIRVYEAAMDAKFTKIAFATAH